MSTLTTLFAGTMFGLALAAPPGPMNAIIAEESVLRGWDAGFRAGLGAAVADFIFFILALLGLVAFVERLPMLRAVMIGIGGVLMLYFAYGTATNANETFQADGPPDGETKGFQKAFILALTNPYQILFWLTVGVGLLKTGRIDVLAEALGTSLSGWVVVETGTPALLVGLFGGIALWITGFPAALIAVGQRVDRFAPVVALVSAVLLAGFGVYFIYDAALLLI
jgi:threonine/homoserine/homoserine lactone efflux protein